MSRIQLGTPQEKELTALVLAKLNDYGWADSDVLANFIVVMVANNKSRDEFIAELNDILPGQASEFTDWLFASIGGPGEQREQDPTLEQEFQDEQPMETVSDESTIPPPTHRHRSSGSRAPSRLLQNAITSATRSDPSFSATLSKRQTPSRVYDQNNGSRRDSPRNTSPRNKSLSPVRAREGISTRGRDDRIRFRRTSQERAQDDAGRDSRLGGRGSGGSGGVDRLRGRLGGNIESRLGRRGDNRQQPSREHSWDNNRDYHDRRGGHGNHINNGSGRGDRDALRDIERRLGSRSMNDEDVPRQPASWSRDPEKSIRTEAEITRQAVDAESTNITRCRFWPNCSQGEACHYWHPRELCTDFPNCPKTADTCLYIHPLAEPTAEQVAAAARQALMQSMKRNNGLHDGENGHINGASGRGQNGAAAGLNALQMPFALGSSTLQDCKFGARCTRPDCKFRHPQGGDSSQPLCRFFPNCTKPNCPFFHPPYGQLLATKDNNMTESGPAVAAPGVSSNDEVLNRLPTPCRFADQCTRPGCHFTHPRDTFSSNNSMPLCKFNPCTRPGCPFRHVASATNAHKTLILNKPSVGTSERFSGGVVAESEVEKLHVPGSSHWANGGVSHQPQQDPTVEQLQHDEAAIQAEMDMDMDVVI
ncbi:hypothetical protein EDD11_005881 [Mortierella claussenii]|nr:hypothetical protein EDD11_005881 [Mortierella claussenii]